MFQSPLQNPSSGSMMAMLEGIEKQAQKGLSTLRKISSKECLQTKSEDVISPTSTIIGHFQVFQEESSQEGSGVDAHDSDALENSISRTDSQDDIIPLVDDISRKSMTNVMQDEWKDCYASCVITESQCESMKDSMKSSSWPYHSLDKCRCSHCTGGSDIASACSTAATTTSTSTTVRNLPLEMLELMEKMEEEMHVSSSTRKITMCEDDHEDNRSFTSAGTCCTDLEELDDLIDDIFLNNMERQWCGKDHLMEHVEHIASLNSPISIPGISDIYADADEV